MDLDEGYKKLLDLTIRDQFNPGGLRFDPERLDHVRYTGDCILFEFISSSISIPYEELTREEARFALKYHTDHFEAKTDESKSLGGYPWNQPSYVFKIDFVFRLLLGALGFLVVGAIMINAIYLAFYPVHDPGEIALNIAQNDLRIRNLQDLWTQQNIHYTVEVCGEGYKSQYPDVANNLTEVSFTTFSFGNTSEQYLVYVDLDNASVAGIEHYYPTGRFIERL